MTGSLRAAKAGLEMVDRARRIKGWTKTRTSDWWKAAHTSQATLRRFWRGMAIQSDAFIDICRAVGVENWEAVIAAFEIDSEMVRSNSSAIDISSSEQQDWSEAPDLMNFYGRSSELALLERWIVKDCCKVVSILGLGGMGKTSLTLTLAGQVQAQFEKLIWKALRNAPPIMDLLEDLIEFVSDGKQELPTATLQQRISQLIQILQERRCLIILDEFETILQSSAGKLRPQIGSYPSGYEGYGELLKRLSSDRHQSCVLITSREKPQGIVGTTYTILRHPRGRQPPDPPPLETTTILELDGLGLDDSAAFLQAIGVVGSQANLQVLSDCYSGNPFALKVIAPIIKEFFGGNVSQFLQQNTIVLSDPLSGVLEQQIYRLSELEREIVYWLAIAQVPISMARLESLLRSRRSQTQILEALISLQYRSLTEGVITELEVLFGLRPMIRKIIRNELVEQATAELCAVLKTQDLEALDMFKHYLFVSEDAPSDASNQKLLKSLKNSLLCHIKQTQKLSLHLTQILTRLQNGSGVDVGYGDRNLAALLKLVNDKSINYGDSSSKVTNPYV